MEKKDKTRTASSAKKAAIKKKLPMIAMIAGGVVLLAAIIVGCVLFSRRGGDGEAETTADTASLAESTASDSPGQTRLGEYISPQDFDALREEYDALEREADAVQDAYAALITALQCKTHEGNVTYSKAMDAVARNKQYLSDDALAAYEALLASDEKPEQSEAKP